MCLSFSIPHNVRELGILARHGLGNPHIARPPTQICAPSSPIEGGPAEVLSPPQWANFVTKIIFHFVSTPQKPLGNTKIGPQQNRVEKIYDALNPGCLIAKVDGPGHVHLPRIFGKNCPPLFIYFYISLHIVHFLFKIDRVMGGERLRRPPLINYQF